MIIPLACIFMIYTISFLRSYKENKKETLTYLKGLKEMSHDNIIHSVLIEETKSICEKLQIKTPTLLISKDKDNNATAFGFEEFPAIVFSKDIEDNLSVDALKSILAHEIHHIKEKHFVTTLLIHWGTYIGSMFLVIALFNLLEMNPNAGLADFLLKDLFLVAMGYAVFTVLEISGAGQTITNIVSRKNEIECDVFAAKTMGIENYLTQAHYFLKTSKIEEPRPLKQKIRGFVLYTHPSWSKRIKAVKTALK